MMVMSNIVFSILFVFYIYLGLLFFVFWYVSDVLLGLLCIYIYICSADMCMGSLHLFWTNNMSFSLTLGLEWSDGSAWATKFMTQQHGNNDWLVVYLPLWKIWVRQLGWLSHIWNGNIKFMFESTNQMRKSRKSHETRLWQEWNIIQHSHLLHHLP